MAQLVLGIGSSHSPALLMEPKAWLKRGDTDDRTMFALHDETGALVQYDDLLARHGDTLAPQLEPSLMKSRYEANNVAIAEIAKRLKDADPDVVIIVGDDHKEVFQEDNMPSLSVYWGTTFPYKPQGFMRWKYADDLKADEWYPQEESEYPVNSDLALRLIGDLCDRGFDPAHSKFYADGISMSHSFGYIYHRIMREKIWPVIPVSINSYYPPNQMHPRRAFQLGRTIRDAVESWPADIRVAILATGGLSHFVVDEEFDRAFLEVIRTGGEEEHAALPIEKLQSGNSELRCWSVVAGAMADYSCDIVDYVPCYRSLAGTGCGMAFVTWS